MPDDVIDRLIELAERAENRTGDWVGDWREFRRHAPPELVRALALEHKAATDYRLAAAGSAARTTAAEGLRLAHYRTERAIGALVKSLEEEETNERRRVLTGAHD